MRDFDKYQKHGAYHYDWYNDPNYAWYKKCVDRCVGFCKGSTLDVGCGEGLVVKLLADKGLEVDGIDDDIEAIRLSLDKTHGYCKLFDINKPIKGSWQYMVCLNVIEHLRNAEAIKRILNRNITKGAIIITDNARQSKGRYHEKEYNKDELIKVFSEFDPEYFEINSTEFGEPITFIGVEISK